MVNQRIGPDDRREMDAQNGVTQEHASTDVDMVNPEIDHTQETNIAESNTARELSDINLRLKKQREDIDENHGMITYIGNAQYFFEGMIDKFDDSYEKHRFDCDRKLEKMSRNLNNMTSTSHAKVARDLHRNKGQIRDLQKK